MLASVMVPACEAGAQATLPAVLRGESRDSAVAIAPRQAQPIGSEALRPDASPAIALSAPNSASTPSDLPRPFAAFSASARSLGDSLVALARAQIGRKYRFGGSTPEHGFDCSGLVHYVLAMLHVPLPRTAKEQARTGAFVERDTAQLRPGDLVTFGSPRHISHIGIYVGGGRFVQASSKAGRVIETPLNRRLVQGAKPWRGARRVVPSDSLPQLPPSTGTNQDDDG
jgi:cell wall-associated NlpC family hydrolase